MKEDFWTPHGQQGFTEGSANFMFLSFWAVHFVTLDISRLQQKIKTVFNLSSVSSKSTWRVLCSSCKRKMWHLLLLKMYILKKIKIQIKGQAWPQGKQFCALRGGGNLHPSLVWQQECCVYGRALQYQLEMRPGWVLRAVVLQNEGCGVLPARHPRCLLSRPQLGGAGRAKPSRPG